MQGYLSRDGMPPAELLAAGRDEVRSYGGDVASGTVRQITFGDSLATGVTYVRDGRTLQARADREVILSGGAVNSPQLLMLSGIGPADHLREHGIPVVVDAPLGQGHIVLLANNPLWRGSTVGSYFLVFNAILNFDNLNAGRKLDEK